MSTQNGKPRVWIVNPGRSHDYSQCGSYGSLVAAFDGKVNIYNTDALCSQIRDVIDAADPKDYMVLGGNVVLCSMFLSAWMSRFGFARMLIWGSARRDYELRELNVDRFTTPTHQAVSFGATRA